jgi:hypothetical protein
MLIFKAALAAVLALAGRSGDEGGKGALVGCWQ